LFAGQPANCDVGKNPLFNTVLGIMLTPVAGIGGHHIRKSAGCGSDELQNMIHVFDVGSLVAHANRHDHLLVAFHRHLAAVTLEAVAIRLL
jgi:hypothetical protein